jgi:hypothetical protein
VVVQRLRPDDVDGLVNCEELSLLVFEAATDKRARDTAQLEQVRAQREQRRAMRRDYEAARAAQEAAQDARDEAEAVDAAVRAGRMRQRHLERGRISKLSARLEADEREDDAEDAVDDEDRAKKRMHSWEAVGLFRTFDSFGRDPRRSSSAPTSPLMRLDDLLTALSLLIADVKVDDSAAAAAAAAAAASSNALPPLPTDSDSPDERRSKMAVIDKRKEQMGTPTDQQTAASQTPIRIPPARRRR